jgi:fumarylacetoacetase
MTETMTFEIDETHDPSRVSWIESAQSHSDFPIQNLPVGVFSVGGIRRGGVAIGDSVLDLGALAESGLLEGVAQTAVLAASGSSLNCFLALGTGSRRELRHRLSSLLSDVTMRGSVERMLHDANACQLHVPARIGDYTDFYVGIHHATNVGKLFRPDAPLLPNYKHVPIGYHGRASSVRASGEPVTRPRGQLKLQDSDAPVFAPSQRLDYELELGVWVGPGNQLGRPIPIERAAEHIVGLSLLNDWSARDLQSWEYQPLGPFLAKNFMTTVSPWIVTAEALAPFRIAQPPRPAGDPAPLPYLWDEQDQGHGAFALTLEVAITTAKMRMATLPPHRLSRSCAQHMYWTVAQLIAHHTSNGCSLEPGDLLGTGTLSAPTPDGYGSLLEISQGGAKPIQLSEETRAFLQDGDEIALTGRFEAEGFVGIGFGHCTGEIRGALDD